MQIQKWTRSNGICITGCIEDEIRSVINREKTLGHDVKLCIGTDSQVKTAATEFATVIVFVRKGKGGFMYVQKDATKQVMSIRRRMLIEVAKSIEVAYLVRNLCSSANVELEVHADINIHPEFKSHDALNEAKGYILGMGFDFKAKPHAFASTSCANKVVQ